MPKPATSEDGTPLRTGWTTGACATAAASAAYVALLTGHFPDPVTIRLPRGQTPSFALAREGLVPGGAFAGVVKDAGDDPDVTHGALVLSTLRALPAGSGIVFKAGPGVGTVTLPGLPLPPGEPAINPVPRAMMREAMETIARRHGAVADVEIEVSIPGGEAIAQRTWNPRLGIVGGLSILGTTGIVTPYSCAAWIHSIYRGIDVARANGFAHVAGCTGSTSEKTVQALLGLPDAAMIDMGDFAGGMLKYLRRHPVPRVTIGGGFAKLTKLAQGLLDLHSSRGEVDLAFLAETAAEAGAPAAVAAAVRAGPTAKAALDVARGHGVPLAETIAAKARATALGALEGAPVAVEVVVVDRQGVVAGRAG
jgi:cobalt-precorrin-5B (C1)-methyltransferase